MKQKAVEWLIDEYFGGLENCTPDFRSHIERAKEMEKQQIKNARHNGRQDLRDNLFMYKEDEQYYNETFKK